ncbi:MAG: hypothetical protein CCU26_18345 [Nitrospira sp. UW-LDO-01]|jgi:hypothetical protein|nr:MAG: hypothetical protein CCU26_18345 [Nitrospira sp. UW-LDO-01]
MEMKHGFIVPIPISLYDLTIRNPRVLHKHIGIRDTNSALPTDIAFNHEAVICFVRRRSYGRETGTQNDITCNYE